MLLKFQHLEITEASTPYDSAFKLTENTGRALARLEYVSGIGSLMYTMHCTRPFFFFFAAVCKLFRYTNNLNTQHWKAISGVLGYLKRIIRL